MSFQPPPPPPGTPPPPPGGTPPPPGPPSGQWGPPPGGQAPAPQPGQQFQPGQPQPGLQKPAGSGAFDPKSVNPLDWGLLGIGVLLLLLSFFEYYTISAGGFSDSAGAWHFGSGAFLGWFAFIAGLAASVIVALSIFAPTVKVPLATYVAALGLFGISFVLYIIGFFAIGPDDSACAGVSACESAVDDAFSFGFSYWVSFILVIAGAVLAIMRAQQTNTALPGPLANIPKIGK